jgi:hypothetical protein
MRAAVRYVRLKPSADNAHRWKTKVLNSGSQKRIFWRSCVSMLLGGSSLKKRKGPHAWGPETNLRHARRRSNEVWTG